MAAKKDDGFRTPAWLFVFYNNMLFGCAGFSIVLPTVWPYLREMGSTTSFLSAVVAAYSVGEGIGGWAIGRAFMRFPNHPKLLLQGGMGIGLLGAFLYTIAISLGAAAPYVLLVGRFMSGVDNGGRQTIEQTFIGTHVAKRHMTVASSQLGSFAVIGIMIGPMLGAPLQALSFRVPVLDFAIDGNNGPGLVLFLGVLMNMVVTSIFFLPQSLMKEDVASAIGAVSDMTGERPSRRGVWTCYGIFFVVNFAMATLETITPVVLQRLYGWGPCLDPTACSFRAEQTYVNMLLSSGGFLSLIMAMMVKCCLSGLIFRREPATIVFTFLLLTCANLMQVDWTGSLPAWRFVCSYCVQALFGGLSRGPCFAMLSQILGPIPKAEYMGTMFMIGAIPRVIGPIALVGLLEAPDSLRSANFAHVYSGPVPRTWLLYGFQATMNFLIVLLIALARSSLRPFREYSKSSLSLPLLADESEADESVMWIPSSTPSNVCNGISNVAPMLRQLSFDSVRSPKSNSSAVARSGVVSP